MEINLSDYIAAGSLLVAVIALVKSFLSDRRVKKLDVLLKEKELQHHEANEEEAKKADVEVEVIETGPKKMNVLRFYNKGQAPAINVSFEIPSDDGIDDITLNMSPDYLPYPKTPQVPLQHEYLFYRALAQKPYLNIFQPLPVCICIFLLDAHKNRKDTGSLLQLP